MRGNLHPDGQVAMRQWAIVVWDWQRERNAGPAAWLAEGVLLDCRRRMSGLYTSFGFGLAVDRRLQTLAFIGTDRVADLFEKALALDPGLIEARFRAAGIRAQEDPTAVTQLEQLASSEANPEVAYLAAVSRAVLAQDQRDVPTAVRWYDRARTIRPGSTAAALGMAAVQPDAAVNFDALDDDDPFYTYPCRFLTPGVGEEVARRVGALTEGR
jgi:hypothetical protein